MENNDIRVASEIPQKGPVPRQAPGSDINIDPVELFYVFLSHWWQIILAAVLGGVLSFGYTYYYVTPTYTTTAKMFLASDASSVTGLLTNSDLAFGNSMKEDYRALLTSRELLQRVIDSLRLTRSVGEVRGMISISSPQNTHIMNITVTSPYPDEAADIANELIIQCRTYLPDIMRIQAPSFYESAQVPTYKSGPNYSQSATKGVLVGAALVCGILLLVYVLNDRVTTPNDLERCLGIQPLGIIPEVLPTSGANKGSRKAKKIKAKGDSSR